DVAGTTTSYTRNGSFTITDDGSGTGYIVNEQGQRLLDDTGSPITVPASSTAGLFANIVNINPDGTLTFNDAANTTAKVGVFDFPSVQGLKAIGETQWTATLESGAAVLITPNIKGGSLEASNVDLTDQLVNMIIAQRNFQANSKIITTNQTLTETATNMIR
ncbi:MAG: flagellar hook protein FlgE, partial [Pseudomonadota bacterium]|nr:flagellar hook protein FlgE [Pseudomonadota bacterium]